MGALELFTVSASCIEHTVVLGAEYTAVNKVLLETPHIGGETNT